LIIIDCGGVHQSFIAPQRSAKPIERSGIPNFRSMTLSLLSIEDCKKDRDAGSISLMKPELRL
jgi:hypothetical protein